MIDQHDNIINAASSIFNASGRILSAYGDVKAASATTAEVSIERRKQFALEKIAEAEAYLKEARALLNNEATNVVSIGRRS